MNHRLALLLLLPACLLGQTSPDMQQVLDRLTRLEQENARLNAELEELRTALSATRGTPAPPVETSEQPPAIETLEKPPSPTEDRLAVQEARIGELSQTSVQTSQRLPVTLEGMVLFNAFLNGSASNGTQIPLTAALLPTAAASNGASVRQTIVGLRYQGPTIFHGGKVSASLNMDLWGGSANSLEHMLRLRTGSIQIDWKNQTIMVGQDKPLIAPRDPSSLAYVAFSPLTASGNLWLWQPQARFEQRFKLGATTGLRAQASVYQTSEPTANATDAYGPVSSARPALQGRFELWSDLTERARVEIAPGFHVSRSHAGEFSIPSHLFTVDWMIRPAPVLQLTGTYFQGQNAAGLGGLRQGFTTLSPGNVVPVHTAGGWTQLSILATSRLSFNLYTGQESNRPSDLLSTQITRNLSYGGNIMYRLGTNVRFSIETNQVRTKYKLGQTRLVNHYDLAIAYLF